MARGTFITLEGTDGSGKTTQAARLAAALEAAGREVVRLREPGGTPISEKVRALLLDPANGAMTAPCELLLYEASRAQLVGEVVEPALARGAWVVCDRFADSTTAYQRAGRGLPAPVVEEANTLACGDCVPDVTLWLDVDPRRALGARPVRGLRPHRGRGPRLPGAGACRLRGRLAPPRRPRGARGRVRHPRRGLGRRCGGPCREGRPCLRPPRPRAYPRSTASPG